MMDARLPEPVTTEQEYLAAILAELRALRSDLRRPQEPGEPMQSPVIELKEPEPSLRKRGRRRK